MNEVVITYLRSTVYYVNVQYLSMYLSYLLANEILHCAHEYLPTFPYLTVYSAIVKKEKKKE